MLGNIGPLEIGIVLVIALLVFGPKRLPELGSGLGRGLREFKTSIDGKFGDEGPGPDEKAQISAADPVPAPLDAVGETLPRS
jgi:sec-independent protein translocase protein TatA